MKRLLLLCLLLLFTISGCIAQQDSLTNLFSIKKTPVYISGLSFANVGNNFKFGFSLLDKNNEFIATSGKGEIKIINSNGEMIYSAFIDVNEDNFKRYLNSITNQQTLVYEWEVSKESIKKSRSNVGTAYFKFKTSDGIEFTIIETSVYNLPVERIPTTIGDFRAWVSGNNLQLTFSIFDQLDESMAIDGNGEIMIFDSEKNVIYSKTLSVKKEDFVTSTNSLAFYSLLGYETNIPLDTVHKSFSSSGIVSLWFNTSQGEFNQVDTSVYGLPSYTQDDLDRLSNNQFEDSAKIINSLISYKCQKPEIPSSIEDLDIPIELKKELFPQYYIDLPCNSNFQVKLIRAGFYTEKLLLGDVKDYYRIDLEVINTGQKSENFYPSSMVIIDSAGNQYEKSYGGTLDTFIDIYSGVKKEGSILFEGVEPNAKSLKLNFKLGYDSNFNPIVFEYNIPD